MKFIVSLLCFGIGCFAVGYQIGIDTVPSCKQLVARFDAHWYCHDGVCDQVGPDPQGHLPQGQNPHGPRCPGGRVDEAYATRDFIGCWGISE